jgi:hypothetical protein
LRCKFVSSTAATGICLELYLLTEALVILPGRRGSWPRLLSPLGKILKKDGDLRPVKQNKPQGAGIKRHP